MEIYAEYSYHTFLHEHLFVKSLLVVKHNNSSMNCSVLTIQANVHGLQTTQKIANVVAIAVTKALGIATFN